MTKKSKPIDSTAKPSATTNGVPETADEQKNDRFEKYLQPEFTQKLIEHMHRAKKKALRKNAED